MSALYLVKAVAVYANTSKILFRQEKMWQLNW